MYYICIRAFVCVVCVFVYVMFMSYYALVEVEVYGGVCLEHLINHHILSFNHPSSLRIHSVYP